MTATPSRSSRPSPQASTQPKPSLAGISSRGNGLPNRYGIGAVEKWGKTSLAAQFPDPIFIESRGETGLETLIDAGRLPETAHFPECNDWLSLVGCVDALIEEKHEYKTAAIDTINGAERLCHEYVCATDFGNDWGPNGFGAYGKGPEAAMSHWRQFLSRLDLLRSEKRMRVVLLYHMRVKSFRNPLGADYDRYEPEMNEKTWGLTKKWLDVILFGNYETTMTAVKTNSKTGEQKGKALDGQTRMLYTERTAAYDAGNRLGLPPEIEMGSSPREAWANFVAALKAGREVVNGQ